MARQEHVNPSAGHEEDTPLEPEPLAPQTGARGAEIDADIDSVLDEIDSVLEGNAADFVANFVQKGGQ